MLPNTDQLDDSHRSRRRRRNQIAVAVAAVLAIGGTVTALAISDSRAGTIAPRAVATSGGVDSVGGGFVAWLTTTGPGGSATVAGDGNDGNGSGNNGNGNGNNGNGNGNDNLFERGPFGFFGNGNGACNGC
jgi:hypothetical protein